MSKSRNRLLLGKQQGWVLMVGMLFLTDFVFYGYLPSHRRLQQLARARGHHKQIISTAMSQTEALPALEKRHKETARMVRRYEDHVPSESALGTFLRQIANIMTEHKLTDQEVNPGKDAEAGELTCIPVQLSCTGTLDGLFGFLSDLPNLPRLVRIEKITLQNDSGFGGTVTMQTEAVIFYRPEKLQEPGPLASDRSLEMANDDA